MSPRSTLRRCRSRSPFAAALLLVAVISEPATSDSTTPPPDSTAPPGSTTPSGPTARSATASLPDGVRVAVEFPRYLHEARQLEAIVDNQSEVELTVVSVRLDSPLFEPARAHEVSQIVRAGRRTDFKMDVGVAVCPAVVAPSRVEVGFRLDGGEPELATVEIDDAPLRRISDTECGEALVHDAVDIGFAQHSEVDGDVVHATITLHRRTGDQPVTVTEVRGSVLYELRPGRSHPRGPVDRDPASTSPTSGDQREPTTERSVIESVPTAPAALVVLEPGADTAELAVELEVVRCEPHAVADAKKPFDFKAWIALGDDEPRYVRVPAPPGLQDALLRQLAACVDRQR